MIDSSWLDNFSLEAKAPINSVEIDLSYKIVFNLQYTPHLLLGAKIRTKSRIEFNEPETFVKLTDHGSSLWLRTKSSQ